MPVSSGISRNRPASVLWMLVAAYVVIYLLASYVDLRTTDLGLQRPSASEQNVFVTGGGEYSATSARLVTLVGAAVLIPCFAFGIFNSARVSELWLDRPRRSFFDKAVLLTVNPWSSRVIDRSPLHYISLALAFPLLRLLAGINNLLVYWGLAGPIGAAMRAVGRATTPAVGFMLVGVGLYFALAIWLAPSAARLIQWVSR